MSSEIDNKVKFRALLVEPVRNGIYKQKEFHGRGCKIINMGELFAFPRLHDVPMKRVELTEKEQSKSLVQQGDLLFARRSLVAEGAGRCSIVSEVNEPTTFESSIIRARPNPTLASSDYLYYFFSSPLGRERMATILRQMAVSGITGSDLMELEIECPELEHQKTIAMFLSALDDRITLLRETNATLEAIAQALFKSWFVDFDPVRAKAEGLEPEGIDAATAALFPDSFVESELGLVPRGWMVRSLDSIANYLNGLAMQKFPPADDGWLPVIKIAQLRKGNTVGADRAGRNIKTEYIIQNGDVLFSWSGSLEVVIWCGGEGALNQHLFKVTSKDFPKWFYYLWTRQHLTDFQQTAASKATTMGHIQRKHLTAAKVVVPPAEVLRSAGGLIEPLLERWLVNAEKAQALTRLRDTLLPRLISGQLRLPEAEEMVEEVFA
ncbi:hypothetical protein PS838_00253 [Pseudomonas fluorescens]|nr:hypothetical protein PS838_00253 [Pseudomonas fluorescens]